MSVVTGVTQAVGKAGSPRRTVRELRTDEDGRLEIAGRPVRSDDVTKRIGTAATNQSIALSTTAQTYTLPQNGGRYLIQAIGNTAYLRWDGGTATTSVGGFTYPVASGGYIEIDIEADEVSFIASSASGSITFLWLRRS